MPSMNWEPTAVKAQLRLTNLRLGQLQEKHDSQTTIIRRDIATLLQQQNVGLARAKAQKLIQDDVVGDLVEILEMHVGLILEHFSEIDRNASLSPNVIEAASSIIYAAPQVDSKDLNDVRNLLIQRLGPDFARYANEDFEHRVSSRVTHALSAPPPSAAALDAYLEETARLFNVNWIPKPQRHDIVNSISEILDPDTPTMVDLVKLRKLCFHGIPDEPAWLRPRIWKLFFGTLPVLKSLWKSESYKQRENYYDLIRRLLDPLSELPPPSLPLSLPDVTLLRASEQLSGISTLPSSLKKEFQPLGCPLDGNLSGKGILSAQNLNIRLESLQNVTSEQFPPPTNTPEILLKSDISHAPAISLSAPDSRSSESQSYTTPPSRTFVGIPRHHSSALLRLLYLHASINPGSCSPHIPVLLVPIYAVLNQEVETADLAHVEADTFWLFEAMVGEFSEIEDEGGSVWMKKFSERLSWADADLSDHLQIRGLDPALPHYSYHWLAPLLAQTLPIDSVYLVWDALFSCQARDRDGNPKLDYLLDICTAMLIHARITIFKLGKGDPRSPGLWDEEISVVSPPSPLHWKPSDAFMEGVSLFQKYPLKSAGGIERILQTASDLCHRREEETNFGKIDKIGLGARLKVTIWKGFTNQVTSPVPSPTDSDESSDGAHNDGNETETQAKDDSLGLTSRLAATVWRGITNQTSMEVPPSPIWPSSRSSRSPSPIPPASSPPTLPQELLHNGIEVMDSHNSTVHQGPAGLWVYAEKFKDSDAAATIAKLSSNWRAKALISTWRRPQQENTDTPTKYFEPIGHEYQRLPKDNNMRRGSLPLLDRSETYSPPPRPLHFRAPRDSFIFPHNPIPSPTGHESSSASNNTLMKRTANMQLSLASLVRTQGAQPTTKAAPRPLLLSASSVVTSPPSHASLQTTRSPPIATHGEWANTLRLKKHNLHRNSQSSISSLSPSDALGRHYKFGWDSDNGDSSTFVPLNRRSVSPMAPKSRAHQGRHTSGSSSTASSDRGISPALGDVKLHNHMHMADSSPLASPSHPQTPFIDSLYDDSVRVVGFEHQSPFTTRPDTLQPKKSIRKRTPPPSLLDETSDSSAAQIPTRNPRTRPKRHLNRPPNLYTQDTARRLPIVERKTPSPHSLAVDWPGDDQDIVITPRASTFNEKDISRSPAYIPRSPRRSRNISAETSERLKKTSAEHDTRIRKNSTSQRTRKVSGDRGDKGTENKARESSADEGDDEGYDELLSAYESEEGLSLH